MSTNLLVKIVSEYSDAVGRYGPDSAQAQAIRQANAGDAVFLEYAEALDRVKRHLGGSGMAKPEGDPTR